MLIVKLPFGSAVNFAAKKVHRGTPVEIDLKLCLLGANPEIHDIIETRSKHWETVTIEEEAVENIDVDHAKRKLNFPGFSPVNQAVVCRILVRKRSDVPEIQGNRIKGQCELKVRKIYLIIRKEEVFRPPVV